MPLLAAVRIPFEGLMGRRIRADQAITRSVKTARIN